VVLAVCAAIAGVAIRAAAATDAINFFMLPPVSGKMRRQRAHRAGDFSPAWRQG
jgi:hypothetical protein